MRRILFIVLLVATGSLGFFAAAGFVFPDGEFQQRVVNLGPLDNFAPGTVTTVVVSEVERGRVHVSRLENGEVRVFSIVSTGLGCSVPWRPNFSYEGATGFFREPCRANTWRRDGTLIRSVDATRDLDQYEAWEDGSGDLVIDANARIRGNWSGLTPERPR